jgi:hypothetical protein
VLAVPFAVWTASPRTGAAFTWAGLCATPEELETPPELAALVTPDITADAAIADDSIAPATASLPPC